MSDAMVTLLERDILITRCKPGQGAVTCSFLSAGGAGWSCTKGTELEAIFRARRPQMVAQGDNCSGAPTFDRRKRA